MVFGGAGLGGSTVDLGNLGASGFTLNGIDGDDRSGRSASSAGDVNGDGFDDLIIGAYGGDPNNNTQAGESYVVFGGDYFNQLNAALLGDNNANTLTGTAADESLIGGRGNDTLDGGAGNDVLIGGEGDDILVYDAADVLRVDGGNGFDTLQLRDGDDIDFTTLNNFADTGTAPGNTPSSIEQIDAKTDTGANVLTFGLLDVLALTDSQNDGGDIDINKLLVILGGAEDSIVFTQNAAIAGDEFTANGTQMFGGETYNAYTVADMNVMVLIDQDIAMITGVP